MPVGHAVIATRCLARFCSAGLSAAAGVDSAAGFGFTTPSTSSTTSSALPALRSDSTKSLRTNARASAVSSFM